LDPHGASQTEALAQADATWAQARAVSEDIFTAVRGAVASLGAQPGPRILVLASGGFLSDTLGDLQDTIIDEALRANVVINALDAKGLYTDDPARPLDELATTVGELPLPTYFFEVTSKLSQHQAEDTAMASLAVSTGGLFFHDNNDLTLGFERLGLAPDVTYDLAFAPTIPHDGKFHQLKVELAPPIKGTIIQARRGYFDPPPGPAAEDLAAALDAAMRASGVSDAMPAAVQARPQPGGVGVHVTLDVGKLGFTSVQGRRTQRVMLVAGLFDGQGKFVTGEQGELELALNDATFKRYRAQGMGASLRLAAVPGSYRLRVVVQEASDGKLSAFSQPVAVH
ncbi:MAG: VWA domain-containing protein, partial [Terriglobales bacterium]